MLSHKRSILINSKIVCLLIINLSLSFCYLVEIRLTFNGFNGSFGRTHIFIGPKSVLNRRSFINTRATNWQFHFYFFRIIFTFSHQDFPFIVLLFTRGLDFRSQMQTVKARRFCIPKIYNLRK